MAEDKPTVEETHVGAAPETEEPTPKETKEEEEVEPEFVCGVMLLLLRDGEGLRFDPIENDNVARKATLTDLNMIAGHLLDHTRALMAADQVLKIGAAMAGQPRITKKGRIIH